jgi:hypothetical protein
MRIIREIPHDRYRIQLLQYNAKFILKIELGQFEQTFKISELDVQSPDELERMMNPDFLRNCLNRFIEMRSDWENAFQSLYQNHQK